MRRIKQKRPSPAKVISAGISKISQHHFPHVFSVQPSAWALTASVTWDFEKSSAYKKCLDWERQESFGNSRPKIVANILESASYFFLNRLILLSMGHVSCKAAEENSERDTDSVKNIGAILRWLSKLLLQEHYSHISISYVKIDSSCNPSNMKGDVRFRCNWIFCKILWATRID